MDFKKSTERYKNFLKLRKNGLSFAGIGKKYKISYQAVQERLKKGKPKNNIKNGNEQRLRNASFKKGAGGRERTRMLVRIRDKFTCQDCGEVRTPEMAKQQKKRLFDIHHLNGECGKKSRKYDKV